MGYFSHFMPRHGKYQSTHSRLTVPGLFDSSMFDWILRVVCNCNLVVRVAVVL